MVTSLSHIGSEDPSDREVVDLLARLARTRAALLEAEEVAAAHGERIPARNPVIEEARADLLWAQAQLCSADGHKARARRALTRAEAAEKAALRRFGFPTFADYARHRTSGASDDPGLEAARVAYRAAQDDWERLQIATRAREARVTVDLTEDAPRTML